MELDCIKTFVIYIPKLVEEPQNRSKTPSAFSILEICAILQRFDSTAHLHIVKALGCFVPMSFSWL